jgi:hypothetical protein
MGLVVFNYVQSKDNPTNAPLLEFKQSMVLPTFADNKKWTLHMVSAVYYDNAHENFQTLEITFPELMTTQNMLLESVGVNGQSAPSKTLRYYANSSEQSQESDGTGTESVFRSLVKQPNLSLGRHNLEHFNLSVVVTARRGDSTKSPVSLNGYSIILSYED